MRRSSDLSRRRRRITGRAVIITLGILFLVVIVFGRAIARFYIEYLWFSSLGRSDVFWTQIRAQVTLFVLFAALFLVLAGVNLVIADRLAPKTFPANVHPYVERFHDLFGRRLRLVRYGVAIVLAIVLALPTTSQWQNWLMFRNSSSFGVNDPQFGVDVGFYVFELPFLAFALDWVFVATLIVLILILATHVLNGGVVFAAPMPSVRPASKGHIAVLLALLAALKAADYWVSRYATTNDQRGFVQGATYTVVNAELPALMLLLLIAVLTAGLFLSTIRTGSWRLPIIASALWLVVALVGGVIYPALVQRLVVRPDQQSRELPYIERNIEATRAAFGIEQVAERPLEPFGELDAADVEADVAPLRDVRLLNPGQFESRFRVDQGQEAGLTITDLDVDRYPVDDEPRQVLVAARELDLGGIPNRSWQGQHLISTRGCGLVMASSSQVLANERPDYRSVDLERPELYFSPELGGYAITNTDQVERGCEEDLAETGTELDEYQGTSGVRMSSFVRRAAFALAFLDYNVLGSQAVNDGSQMLWIRDVNERVRKLAPFLSFDGDPYPVAHDGRVVWIVDAFTTTSRYPYSQRIGDVQRSEEGGLSSSDNYARNSVKAVVDGYDGSVDFYVVDPNDPILRTWQRVYPDLLLPPEDIPEDLRAHFRYPEDLFRVQTDLYSKYRLEPEVFFGREGAWSVAQAPGTQPGTAAAASTNSSIPAQSGESDFATESGSGRFTPYYAFFAPPDGRSEFVMIRPLVPFSPDDSRTELQAYMTVSSDPDRYGELVAYRVAEQAGDLPDGPLQVGNQLESDTEISQRITLLNEAGGGTQVTFGDMQLVPIADGVIWVRPLYVALTASQGEQVTNFRYVLVNHNSRAAFGDTLGEALAKVFPGFEADIGDRVEAPSDPEATPDDPGPVDPTDPTLPSVPTVPTTPTDPSVSVPDTTPSTGTVDPEATVDELLAEADELLVEADQVLRESGDLGEYQRLVQRAGQLIDAARERAGPVTTDATDTSTPTASSTSPGG